MAFSSTIHLHHCVASRLDQSSGRRIKFDAVKQSTFFIGIGKGPKLIESGPYFVSVPTAFTPHHSLKRVMLNARHDQIDDCAFDELMKYVNGAMLDPMVEVDPVTISKQLQAEKESVLMHNGGKNLVMQDACTSVSGANLCYVFQTFKGFHGMVFLAVTTLIIFLVATVRKTKMSDKSWHVNVDAADSFARLDHTMKFGKRREVVAETIKATQGNGAVMAEWPAAEQGVVEKYRLTKRPLSKRWADQTELINAAELNNDHIHSSEAESHSSGTSFHSNSASFLPGLLPACAEIPSKEASESQIGSSIPLKSVHSPYPLPSNRLRGFCPSKRLDNSVIKGSVLFPIPSSAQRYVEKVIETVEELSAHEIESSMLLPHQPVQNGDSTIDLLEDGQNFVEPTTDSSVKDPEISQKSFNVKQESFANSLQKTLPALMVGVGAVGSLTGVGRGLQVIGFAAILSLISYELLWAQTREQLWQDLKVISDRRKFVEFLKKRNIVQEV